MTRPRGKVEGAGWGEGPLFCCSRSGHLTSVTEVVRMTGWLGCRSGSGSGWGVGQDDGMVGV